MCTLCVVSCSFTAVSLKSRNTPDSELQVIAQSSMISGDAAFVDLGPGGVFCFSSKFYGMFDQCPGDGSSSTLAWAKQAVDYLIRVPVWLRSGERATTKGLHNLLVVRLISCKYLHQRYHINQNISIQQSTLLNNYHTNSKIMMSHVSYLTGVCFGILFYVRSLCTSHHNRYSNLPCTNGKI